MTLGFRRTLRVVLVDRLFEDAANFSLDGELEVSYRASLGRTGRNARSHIVLATPIFFSRFGGLGSRRGKRLRLLAAVAIDGDCLDALLPGLEIGFGDIFDRSVLGQVDRFGD